MTGVSFDRKSSKYRAYINFGGKRYFLGFFSSFGEAQAVRERAESAKQSGIVETLRFLFPTLELPDPDYFIPLGAIAFLDRQYSPINLAVDAIRTKGTFPTFPESEYSKALSEYLSSVSGRSESVWNILGYDSFFYLWTMKNMSFRAIASRNNCSVTTVIKYIFHSVNTLFHLNDDNF